MLFEEFEIWTHYSCRYVQLCQYYCFLSSLIRKKVLRAIIVIIIYLLTVMIKIVYAELSKDTHW